MKTIIVCLFMLSGIHLILASNGKIAGKIIDKRTGEPLIGASVQVENIKAGSTTDLEGRYTISGLEDGIYTLVSQYVSYKTQYLKEIRVKNGETTLLDIYLEESANEMQEVTILASTDKHSVANMLLIQQNNISITSGISQDDIRRSPDKNTSDVLKRISGASVQENKFVIIRGLADRYNTALINGMPLPTSEPDRKAFSFDIFPSSMLDNLLIFKTATPDLPGDFAGGVIQVNTRDIPEDPFIIVGVGTGFHGPSAFKEYYTYQGGHHDWLGRDDGTRNILNDAPGTDSLKSLLSILDPEIRNSAAHYLDSDWSRIYKSRSPLNQSYQLSMGHHIKLFKRDFGVIFASTYSHSRRTTVVDRSDFNTDTSTIFRYQDTQFKENIQLGSMLNLAYKFNDFHKVSLKNMFNNNAEDIFTNREGIHYENDRFERGTTLHYTSNSIITSQLSGDHYLPKSEIKLRWGASYTHLSRDIPNLRRIISFRSTGDTVWYAAVTPAPSPNYAGMFFSDLYDKIYTAQTDVAIPVSKDKKKHILKWGGSWQYKLRDFNARAFGYKIASPSKFEWELLQLSHDSLFVSENIGRPDQSGFTLAETTNPSDNYAASSVLTSGFIMFENKINKKFRAVWGIRAEQYHLQLNAFEYDGDTVVIDTTYRDFLPSGNLIYSINDKSSVRLAISKTLCRPEFREIAPFSFFDFNTYSAIIGNDTLQPTKIYNYDLKYEIYLGHNQMFAFGLFYKNFNNPIENIMFYGGAGSRSRSLQNVRRATNYGAELEYRFKLSLLDSILSTNFLGDFTWTANLAWIRSSVDLSETKGVDSLQKERPLQGQSPFIVNTGLQYFNQKRGTGFALLFNRIGRRISEVGSSGYADIYENSRSIVDFQISQKILKKKAEIKFTVSDLFAREVIMYQDENLSGKYESEEDKRITGFKPGMTLGLSFTYKW